MVVRRWTIFISKPYEVTLYLLQQLLVASQSGEAIGFIQLLYATLFHTVEPEIAINYFVYSQSVSECQFHMRSHDSIGAFLDFLPDWAQGLRHSQCSCWRTQNAVCRCPVADQSYPLFGFSLTKCRYFHILSTCYETVWQLDWKNLCVNKILFNVVYSQKQYVVYGEICHFCRKCSHMFFWDTV